MSWTQQARATPRYRYSAWVTWAVAAALLIDLLHFSMHFWSMRILTAAPELAAAPEPTYQSVARPHRPMADARRVIGAHLFGVSAADAAIDAADTRVPMALSGVIVMDNPGDGYAILGQNGQMRVYRVGSELSGALTGRVAQVLDDRVILAVDGRIETLRLPRQLSRTNAPVVQVAMTDASRPDGGARADDADAAATALAARRARMNSLSSATQRWLAVVSADRDNLSAHGIPVHPNRHYEREYGLHDGDVVTAINGVPITDEDALDNALKSSTGTMSLTFSHDGAPQTVNVPLSQ